MIFFRHFLSSRKDSDDPTEFRYAEGSKLAPIISRINPRQHTHGYTEVSLTKDGTSKESRCRLVIYDGDLEGNQSIVCRIIEYKDNGKTLVGGDSGGMKVNLEFDDDEKCITFKRVPSSFSNTDGDPLDSTPMDEDRKSVV